MTALSVCFFSHSSLLGGAQRSLLELIRELARDFGVACTVVLSEEGPLRPRLEAAGARTLCVPYSWWGQKGMTPSRLEAGLVPSMAGLLTRAIPEIEKDVPDVVVTNTLVIPWGAVAAALLDRPHVWNACEFGPRDSSLIYFAPAEAILDTIRRCAGRAFVPSESVRRELFADMSEGSCVNIGRYVEIPPEALSQRAPEPPARRGTARVGLFATLTPDKGQRIAVAALAELLRRGRDVELVLAGTPTEPFAREISRAVAEQRLKGRVRILGFLDNPYPSMAQTDVILAPFRQDAFARVVVEAMLLGKPVVASDAGGLPSLVRDGFNGFLVPHGDVARLAGRVEELIADREKAKRLGENGQRFVRATFSPETFGGRAHQELAALKGSPAAPFPNLLFPFLRRAVREIEAGREKSERASAAARGELEEARADLETAREQIPAFRAGSKAKKTNPVGRAARVTRPDQAPDTTLAWRLRCLYWRMLDHVLPSGSRGREIYRRVRGLSKRTSE